MAEITGIEPVQPLEGWPLLSRQARYRSVIPPMCSVDYRAHGMKAISEP